MRAGKIIMTVAALVWWAAVAVGDHELTEIAAALGFTACAVILWGQRPKR